MAKWPENVQPNNVALYEGKTVKKKITSVGVLFHQKRNEFRNTKIKLFNT